MPQEAPVAENRDLSGAPAPEPADKEKNALRHDLANEIAVITGFAWLALASLQQLGEKLEGDARTELQSIIAMVERVKISAEQGAKLLAPRIVSPAAPDAEAAKAQPHT